MLEIKSQRIGRVTRNDFKKFVYVRIFIYSNYMSKLNLKCLNKKDDDYDFRINEPDEFLTSQEYVEGTDNYYPFFKE